MCIRLNVYIYIYQSLNKAKAKFNRKRICIRREEKEEGKFIDTLDLSCLHFREISLAMFLYFSVYLLSF